MEMIPYLTQLWNDRCKGLSVKQQPKKIFLGPIEWNLYKRELEEVSGPIRWVQTEDPEDPREPMLYFKGAKVFQQQEPGVRFE